MQTQIGPPVEQKGISGKPSKDKFAQPDLALNDLSLPGLARSVSLKYALPGICLILFMVNLDASIVVVGLPTMTRSFHSGFATAQWIVLSYMLALTALIAGAGRLGDLFGKKKLYLTGIALFTLASLGCGLAANAGTLITLRALQGVGAAFCISLSFAIAGDMVPKERMGKTMGILTTMVPLGIASGPTIGGLLLSAFGWPSMFLVNLPVGITAWLLIRKHTHARKPPERARVDYTGMLLLSFLLGCYALGMTYMEEKGMSHPLVLSLLGGAVLGLFLFIRFENRTPHPFLKISLFRNRVLSASLLASVLVYIVMTSTFLLFPFYLGRACGFKPLTIGLIMSFGPLITALLSVQAGKIADRFGARKLMLTGVLIMAAGSLAMSTVDPGQGILGFLWRIALLQLGLTFFQTPNNAAVMELAAPDQRGLLSGLLSLSRSAGQITGAAVMGAIFAILVSGAAGRDTTTAGPAAITRGLNLVFLIAAGLSVLAALFIYLAIRNYKKSLNSPVSS